MKLFTQNNPKDKQINNRDLNINQPSDSQSPLVDQYNPFPKEKNTGFFQASYILP